MNLSPDSLAQREEDLEWYRQVRKFQYPACVPPWLERKLRKQREDDMAAEIGVPPRCSLDVFEDDWDLFHD